LSFDFKEDVDEIELDLTLAHLWDDSAVGAIDKVMIKYHQQGTKVKLIGLNNESKQLVSALAVHDKPGGLEKAVSH
jgi:MFS superfamily sulfate permease-like transporter